jgi:hypothetical protein
MLLEEPADAVTPDGLLGIDTPPPPPLPPPSSSSSCRKGLLQAVINMAMASAVKIKRFVFI